MVIRKHLPRGVMVLYQFPILIHPATTAVMIVPSRYWPRALIRDRKSSP